MSRADIVDSTDAAVAGIEDGSTVLVGGFGLAGMPFDLIDALIRQGAKDLTIVSNNAGNGDVGLAALLAAGRVRKVLCSFPRQADSWVFDGLYRAGEIELKMVPQGNLAERMRAAAPIDVDRAGPADRGLGRLAGALAGKDARVTVLAAVGVDGIRVVPAGVDERRFDQHLRAAGMHDGCATALGQRGPWRAG